MSDLMKRTLLIGAGSMAIEYAKVLKAQGINFTCIGRSSKTAEVFSKKTGFKAHTGGIEKYLEQNRSLPSTAIVCVSVDQLSPVTLELLKYGIKHILVEKPGGLHLEDIGKIKEESKKHDANVYVAYNRRFYASTLQAKEMISEDGGVQSFHFDFTELGNLIQKSKTNSKIKENWLLANSTHVIDLAFYLGGEPHSLHSYTTGSLSWHPSGSIFSGAGITKNGALFSYHANWTSPGRWGIELVTKKRRILLQPLEELYTQQLGSFEFKKANIENEIDHLYKPGLYRLTQSFFDSNKKIELITIEDQYRKTLAWYEKMKTNSY